MGVGVRIKIALREKKMTIKQLSQQSGISINTLYSITKRDSDNVDILVLEDISHTLGLPASFFSSSAPFENLEFLDTYKGVILSALEHNNLFSWNGRALVEVNNIEFWQAISEHIVYVNTDENGDLDIQYGPSNNNCGQEKIVPLRTKLELDFNKVLAPLIERNEAMRVYMVLRQLDFLTHDGIEKVLRYAEEIAQNPFFQIEK